MRAPALLAGLLACVPESGAATAARLEFKAASGEASPLSEIGAAAGGAGYVRCKLALEHVDLAELAANASLRIGVTEGIARAVAKATEDDVPSHAVMAGIRTGGHVEVGVVLPDSVKAENLVGKLGSSFAQEASDALSSGCCSGASVTVAEECSLLSNGEEGETAMAKTHEGKEEGKKEENGEEEEDHDDDVDDEKEEEKVSAKSEEKKGEEGEAEEEKKKEEEKKEEKPKGKGGGILKGLLVSGCTIVGLVGACGLLVSA